MRRIKMKDGVKVVRVGFKRALLGTAALMFVSGLAGGSFASPSVKVVKDEAKKVVGKAQGATKEVKDQALSKTKVPEFVDINTQASCPDMKGLKKDIKHVNHFTHAAHIEMLKKEGKDFVCATCHKGVKSEEELLKEDKCQRMEMELKETGGPAKLKNYFHSTCLKCHKELKKQGKDTGPVSCKGCHGRKAGEK